MFLTSTLTQHKIHAYLVRTADIVYPCRPTDCIGMAAPVYNTFEEYDKCGAHPPKWKDLVLDVKENMDTALLGRDGKSNDDLLEDLWATYNIVTETNPPVHTFAYNAKTGVRFGDMYRRAQSLHRYMEPVLATHAARGPESFGKGKGAFHASLQRGLEAAVKRFEEKGGVMPVGMDKATIEILCQAVSAQLRTNDTLKAWFGSSGFQEFRIKHQTFWESVPRKSDDDARKAVTEFMNGAELKLEQLVAVQSHLLCPMGVDIWAADWEQQLRRAVDAKHVEPVEPANGSE